MDFSVLDENKTEAYAAEAKARWGDTPAYREYARRTAGQSEAEKRSAGEGLMDILSGFGPLKEKPASDAAAQAQVKLLQAYITAHFYTCTNKILAGLGQLYAAGGDFTRNIDRACGAGTAAFAAAAIAHYCGAAEP